MKDMKNIICASFIFVYFFKNTNLKINTIICYEHANLYPNLDFAKKYNDSEIICYDKSFTL